MANLYCLTIEHQVVVLADNPDEAESFAEEALKTECISSALISASKINPHRPLLPMGWTPETLVYHAGTDDITLKEALDQASGERAPIPVGPGQMELLQGSTQMTSKPLMQRGEVQS